MIAQYAATRPDSAALEVVAILESHNVPLADVDRIIRLMDREAEAAVPSIEVEQPAVAASAKQSVFAIKGHKVIHACASAADMTQALTDAYDEEVNVWFSHRDYEAAFEEIETIGIVPHMVRQGWLFRVAPPFPQHKCERLKLLLDLRADYVNEHGFQNVCPWDSTPEGLELTQLEIEASVELEDGCIKFEMDGSTYTFDRDSVCVWNDDPGFEFWFFHRLAEPTVDQIIGLIKSRCGSVSGQG